MLREDELMSDPMFESFDPPKAMFTGPSDEGIGAEGGTNGQSGIDPEELEALLAEKFEEGRQVGLAEGRDEIEEKVTASYEALNARMVEITKGIESEVAEHVGSLQKKALEFALEIARKILKTTAEIKPEYIYDIIRKGVDSLGAAEPIKIRVSLDDYEFLDVIGLPSDINEGELGVRYVADENISSGCVIETNYGEISLELDTMWEQVRDNLFPKG